MHLHNRLYFAWVLTHQTVRYMPKLFVVQQYEIFANVLENYKLGYQYENLLFVQVTNGLLINTHCPPVFLCVVATLQLTYSYPLLKFPWGSIGEHMQLR